MNPSNLKAQSAETGFVDDSFYFILLHLIVYIMLNHLKILNDLVKY